METKKQRVEAEQAERPGLNSFVPRKIDIDKEMESFFNATRVNLPPISNPFVKPSLWLLVCSHVMASPFCQIPPVSWTRNDPSRSIAPPFLLKSYTRLFSSHLVQFTGVLLPFPFLLLSSILLPRRASHHEGRAGNAEGDHLRGEEQSISPAEPDESLRQQCGFFCGTERITTTTGRGGGEEQVISGDAGEVHR